MSLRPLLAVAVFASCFAAGARPANAAVCDADPHVVTREPGRLRYETYGRCFHDGPGAPDTELLFPYALPAGSTIEGEGVEPVVVGGRIVGLHLDADRARGTPLRLVTRTPLGAGAEEVLLAPPMLGSGPEVVVFRDRELGFTPSEDFTRVDIGHRFVAIGGEGPYSMRRTLERIHELRAKGDRLMLTADPTVVAHHGVVGRLETRAERHRGFRFVLVSVAALALFVLAYAHRRFRAAAELEEAEAMIREDLERFDPTRPRGL